MRARRFLFQRIYVAIQRFNAVLIYMSLLSSPTYSRTSSHRRPQAWARGDLPPSWKCCKMLFVLQMLSKESANEVFMHYFETMSSASAGSLTPDATGALLKDPAGRFRSSGVTRVGVTRDGNWGCHPYFLKEMTTFFRSSLSLLLISLGCHSPGGCHPSPFHLSDLVCPLWFVNSPTKFFCSGVTPWRVSFGAVRPLPSDATVPFPWKKSCGCL